jgi:Protein of unknown function (DUF3179)
MRRKLFPLGLLLLTACGPALTPQSDVSATPAASVAPALSATATPLSQPTRTLPPEEPAPTLSASATPLTQPARPLLPEEPAPDGAAAEFKTDFKRHTVPYGEILSGGPPKDGIPAIDAPAFVSVTVADTWLRPTEAVAYVAINGDARAYPVQVLTWHEIVNDIVGGVPLAVTYCPLCNTAIAFERTFDGRQLDFGTTGRLRYSNMVMYDRQSETWWQQGNGEAIAGEHAGRRLTQRPVLLISWADFKAAHPDGKVLSRDTGMTRAYSFNPYEGYDNPARQPFLYQGPDTPTQLPALERVLTIEFNGDAVAFPYTSLAERRVLTDIVGGQAVVVLWSSGTASPLDTVKVADGRDIGAAAAYSRELDGRLLDFVYVDGAIKDAQTASTWTHLGRAVSGELAGQQLAGIVAVNHFWFSWAAFYPATRIKSS